MRKLITSIPVSAILVFYLGFSIMLTLVSFYIEHVLGVQACTMCWWQRYTHWALWGVSLSAIFLGNYTRPIRFIRLLVAIAFISSFIGIYQSLGQFGLIELPAFCGGHTTHLATSDQLLNLLTQNTPKPANCGKIDFTIFGLSLAVWNGILMASITAFTLIWLKLNNKVK